MMNVRRVVYCRKRLFEYMKVSYYEDDRCMRSYDAATETAVIKVEVQGTAYEGRTDRIEFLSVGDELQLVR